MRSGKQTAAASKTTASTAQPPVSRVGGRELRGFAPHTCGLCRGADIHAHLTWGLRSRELVLDRPFARFRESVQLGIYLSTVGASKVLLPCLRRAVGVRALGLSGIEGHSRCPGHAAFGRRSAAVAAAGLPPRAGRVCRHSQRAQLAAEAKAARCCAVYLSAGGHDRPRQAYDAYALAVCCKKVSRVFVLRVAASHLRELVRMHIAPSRTTLPWRKLCQTAGMRYLHCSDNDCMTVCLARAGNRQADSGTVGRSSDAGRTWRGRRACHAICVRGLQAGPERHRQGWNGGRRQHRARGAQSCQSSCAMVGCRPP